MKHGLTASLPRLSPIVVFAKHLAIFQHGFPARVPWCNVVGFHFLKFPTLWLRAFRAPGQAVRPIARLCFGPAKPRIISPGRNKIGAALRYEISGQN
jgi:hypothetical protein